MKILYYDNGLNTELAITLAKAGHSVGYVTPWTEAFPKPAKAYIGHGLEGLTPIESFTKALPKADLVVCPDTFSADRVLQAKQDDKPVWGAGEAERLELDRPYMKKLQSSLGLEVGEYDLITGIDDLIKYLQTHKDRWIKSSKYRQFETFKHTTWESTKHQHLGAILDAYGPAGEEMTFLAEVPLKGQEVGIDNIRNLAGFGSPQGWGYEAKDEAYIGTHGEFLPPLLQNMANKLEVVLDSYNASTFFSNEVIVESREHGKMIEPTLRCPHPPTAGMLCMYRGLPLVITKETSNLDPIKPYCAVLVLRSSWAGDHWTEITLRDPSLRDKVKLSMACRKEGKYFAVPGNEFIGHAVGLGDSPEQAVKEAKKVAGTVSAKEMDVNPSALDKLMEETIPNGRKVGINF